MIEDLRSSIILESDLQKMEAIECSLSGELVPFEEVQREFNNFVERLKKKMIIYDVSLNGLQLREHEKNRIIDNCSQVTSKSSTAQLDTNKTKTPDLHVKSTAQQ